MTSATISLKSSESDPLTLSVLPHWYEEVVPIIWYYFSLFRPGDIVFGCICVALVVFLKVNVYYDTWCVWVDCWCIIMLMFVVQYFKVHVEHLRESRKQTRAGEVALKFLWLMCTGQGYTAASFFQDGGTVLIIVCLLYTYSCIWHSTNISKINMQNFLKFQIIVRG